MFKAILEPFRHPKPVIELGAGRALVQLLEGSQKQRRRIGAARSYGFGATLPSVKLSFFSFC